MRGRLWRLQARGFYRNAVACLSQRAAIGLITTFLFLSGVAAEAATIDITAGAEGVLTPSLATASVLTFDDLAPGSLPVYQFVGGSLAGSGAVRSSSLAGAYQQPPGDTTNFMTVSYPSRAGSVQFSFDALENYFGLYWGSIDSYNSISFLMAGQTIETFSGTDIANIIGLSADMGPQSLARPTRYINFYLGSTFYNEVVLGTTDLNFEFDNVAFADPPVDVPEPNVLPLLGLVGFCLVFARHRRLFG